ncbi:hypothetical protein HNY73_001492 [Argiope bruennichi]|uniref:Uncharacterized protein n=1 Tax=Argiope bruennichi TaxID=94029 RepID=A0A8T0G1X6_ARGBR|nr:hypothetical protein HNY73_001492 [Argiope bruennichi]
MGLVLRAFSPKDKDNSSNLVSFFSARNLQTFSFHPEWSSNKFLNFLKTESSRMSRSPQLKRTHCIVSDGRACASDRDRFNAVSMTTDTAIRHGRDENEFQGRICILFFPTGISLTKTINFSRMQKECRDSGSEFSELLSYCDSCYPSRAPSPTLGRTREKERPLYVLTLRNSKDFFKIVRSIKYRKSRDPIPEGQFYEPTLQELDTSCCTESSACSAFSEGDLKEMK